MSTVRIRSIRRIRVQTIVNQSWKEIHARTIPNPPGSPRAGRALTNQFSQKILREPRECATLVLTTAIRAPGPAATRHFATNEDSLPILPMSPNHAERTAALPAQPCRIRPLSAFYNGPSFRTSQIVSDRLGSSQIVWDRPSTPLSTARHSRRNAEIFARFRPPDRQKKRVKTRHFAPKRGKIHPQALRKKSFFATDRRHCHFQLLVNKCRHLQHSCVQL